MAKCLKHVAMVSDQDLEENPRDAKSDPISLGAGQHEPRLSEVQVQCTEDKVQEVHQVGSGIVPVHFYRTLQSSRSPWASF